MIRNLARFWRVWLRFATILGNIQMVILLTVIYWTMLMVVAIPFKLRSDPLSLKRKGPHGWIYKKPVSDVLASMRKQG